MDHYLDIETRGAANAKAREQVQEDLAEAEAQWRPITHPDRGDPTSDGYEPEWWDEAEAGREALGYVPGGRAAVAALTRTGGTDPR